MKKGEAKKGSGETKGDTEKQTKMPFFKGKNKVFCSKQRQEENNKKTQTKATKNKEGLGPSEVALRATSP